MSKTRGVGGVWSRRAASEEWRSEERAANSKLKPHAATRTRGRILVLHHHSCSLRHSTSQLAASRKCVVRVCCGCGQFWPFCWLLVVHYFVQVCDLRVPLLSVHSHDWKSGQAAQQQTKPQPPAPTVTRRQPPFWRTLRVYWSRWACVEKLLKILSSGLNGHWLCRM